MLYRLHEKQITSTTLERQRVEVLKIQQEGRTKRKEAEAEMFRMENELKQKLLEIQR